MYNIMSAFVKESVSIEGTYGVLTVKVASAPWRKGMATRRLVNFMISVMYERDG